MAGPGDLNVDLGRCLPPRQDLPLPGEVGDGLVTGGAAGAFPVIGYVVEPALTGLTDAFWVVAVAVAVVLAARLAGRAVELPRCFRSEVASAREAAAAFCR